MIVCGSVDQMPKRTKKIKKTLTYFRVAHGFSEPYRVLIMPSVIMHHHNLADMMKSYTALTTPCIMSHLRNLGRVALDAVFECKKSFQSVACHHSAEHPLSPMRCAFDVLKRFGRMFVMLSEQEDKKMYVKALQVASVGVIRVDEKTGLVHMMSPSEISKRVAGDKVEKQLKKQSIREEMRKRKEEKEKKEKKKMKKNNKREEERTKRPREEEEEQQQEEDVVDVAEEKQLVNESQPTTTSADVQVTTETKKRKRKRKHSKKNPIETE